MLAYIVRRLLATAPVMLVVAIFVFGLLHLSPGDPGQLLPAIPRARPILSASGPHSASISRCIFSSAIGRGGFYTAISASRSLPTCRSRR
jgi:ABC-type microcin C transport system permease subunit YejB